MNLSGNNIKRYILRRYSIDELESILNQKLNNQSRNLKHYANKSLDKFMNIVVYSITEEILVQLTDGWVEDSPIPEEGLYEFIQEIFGERIIKKYDELTNMNLQENIDRIHQMMGVINEDNRPNVIKNMIDELGIISAIKMVGNYYTIEPYLKEIDKVNFIKEKVGELSEEFGGGFGLVEIDEEPILFSEDENELRQIEYLGKNRAMVDVYDEDMGTHLGDYNIPYESLPSQIIEELVEILLNH